MRGMQRSLLPGVLALLAVACVPRSGRIESNRFQHERYPYAVFFVEPVDPAAPFGKAWRVDALSPATARERELKGGDEYTLNRIYDLNEDGRGDFERLEQRYDLLLEHASANAAMWIATFPLAERATPAMTAEQSALGVLARRYITAMAAEGEIVPSFGPESTEAPASSAAIAVESTRACSLSEREALRSDVSFSQGGEQRKVSVVMVRTGYHERITDGAGGAGRYPVFMVIGVMAKPEQRAALEPEFQSLLDHTVLGDSGLGLSMHGVNTCGSQAPEPATGGAEQPAAAPAEPSPEQGLAPMPPEEAPAPQ
jgi:hypothetical protein